MRRRRSRSQVRRPADRHRARPSSSPLLPPERNDQQVEIGDFVKVKQILDESTVAAVLTLGEHDDGDGRGSVSSQLLAVFSSPLCPPRLRRAPACTRPPGESSPLLASPPIPSLPPPLKPAPPPLPLSPPNHPSSDYQENHRWDNIKVKATL